MHITSVLPRIIIVYSLALVSSIHAQEKESTELGCPRFANPNKGKVTIISPVTVSFTCDAGYHISGHPSKTCINGSWRPDEPIECLPNLIPAPITVKCHTKPIVLNGRVQYEVGSPSYPKPEGSEATVVCDEGYSNPTTFMPRYKVKCNQHGMWTTEDGLLEIRCTLPTYKECASPPEVPHAVCKLIREPLNGIDMELQAEYRCNEDFKLLDAENSRLTCINGEWINPIPTCVPLSPCKRPRPIPRGNWKVKGPSQSQPDINQHREYEMGVEVEYQCNSGYKLYGPKFLQCESSGLWSSEPPECIAKSERVWFCPQLPTFPNGYCKCVIGSEDGADLTLCMPFRRGAQAKCTCDHGFVLHGSEHLTCSHANSMMDEGVWDKMPSCVRNFDSSGDLLDIPPYNSNDGRYNSGDITDGKNRVSSLVIVVTTACSVLGVLLIIMAVLVFRRRKPHLVRGMMGTTGGSHLFQQGPAPPPYARVHSASIDEHDRLALMAYAEASRVHLPTYEEAMRLGGNCTNSTTVCSSSSVLTLDYCGNSSRLHHQHQQHHGLPPGRVIGSVNPNIHSNNNNMGFNDGNNNINNNNNNNSNTASNRHSIVTTSSGGGLPGGGSNHMYRDGVSVSEMFGSIDTVNVSMSDASTAVTLETYDSGTSCGRSVGSASQQANAGSLTSSHDQLANDDAPLLDSSSQRETDVLSVSSNPSRTSKDDQ